MGLSMSVCAGRVVATLVLLVGWDNLNIAS